MLGADKPSNETIEKFCRVHEWVLPSPHGLKEVRPRGQLSYLKCKQSSNWLGAEAPRKGRVVTRRAEGTETRKKQRKSSAPQGSSVKTSARYHERLR